MKKIILAVSLMIAASSAWGQAPPPCTTPNCNGQVPEPETLILLAIGTAGMLAAFRLKK